jgi:hypothetical protein
MGILSIIINKNYSLIRYSRRSIVKGGIRKMDRQFYIHLLFSHHPPCPKYDSHTINVGKIQLCIGCFIGYPSGVLAGLMGSWLYLSDLLSLQTLFLTGLVMFSAILLSFTPWTTWKPLKIIQKFSVGAGGGFILSVAFFSVEWSVYYRVGLVWGVAMLLLTPVGILHYRGFKKTCQGCPYHEDLINCPLYSEKPYPTVLEDVKQE